MAIYFNHWLRLTDAVGVLGLPHGAPRAGVRGQVVRSSAGISHRRVKVRWVTPLGDETASLS